MSDPGEFDDEPVDHGADHRPDVQRVGSSHWRNRPIVETLYMRIQFGPCWTWTGGLTAAGYGRVSSDQYVHRVVYELLVGPIPEGLELDHLCRNRACCRPDHLEPVTHAENIRRGQAGEANRVRITSATHCVSGHEYTPENTALRSGHRACRVCEREGQRRRYQEKKV